MGANVSGNYISPQLLGSDFRDAMNILNDADLITQSSTEKKKKAKSETLDI